MGIDFFAVQYYFTPRSGGMGGIRRVIVFLAWVQGGMMLLVRIPRFDAPVSSERGGIARNC